MKQILIIILITFSITGFSKSRPVFLNIELDSAIMIQYAKIIDYQKTTLTLQLINSNDTVTCNVYSNISEIKDYTATGLTGLLPPIGVTILVVIDIDNRLSLIAKQVDNNKLRFWSPIESGSTAMFYYNEPVEPIPNEKGIDLENSDYLTCWDGCLFPKEKLVYK